MPELSLEAWRVRVNVSALDDEARRRLLDRVKGKFGLRRPVGRSAEVQTIRH